MNTKSLLLGIVALVFLSACSGDKTEKATSKYTYESVENDPFGLRIYTLDNGLKVYLSVNQTEPRIQTNIAVRTGSKQDPADATGLAHYLEHMVFKGTSEIGSLNWEEEKKYLQMISDLYEEHRNTTDEEARKAIYTQIDSLSQIAASYVAANEYPKMINGLGAQGTNAYTSNERTVYINDIPATELEKWLAIESERFSELVLRLFHTELEAVYEEFNRSQDSDGSQVYFKTLELLFPTHPYGQQTTIGEGEHLKNPSMQKIHDYFKRRYVPNNMAIVLAGDLDPDKTMELIEKYFGGMESQPLEEMKMPVEEPITEPRTAEVLGSEAEFETVAFRMDGAGSKDDMYLELLDGILSNGKAGLIDLNLNQSQKVLRAYSYYSVNEDYSWFTLRGNPREGQSLEEVRTLLLAQLDSVKDGNYEDWMIDAVVRKFKKDLMNQLEYNWIRAYTITDAFILNKDWKDEVRRYDDMAKITKADMSEWASQKFNNNYVAVSKRIGKKDVHKVEKPAITPVEINREENSAFYARIDSMESMRLKPQFIDFNKEIANATVGDKVNVNYVKNEQNVLFNLYYVLNMGKNHNEKLALAIKYLPYLGTNEMSPAEVQKELFKLGVSFDVYVSDEKSYVMLNGLSETFEEGVKLFEHILENAVADQSSYDELIKGELKERADRKLSKYQILYSGMSNYAKHGPENPFNSVMSEAELKAIDPNELVGIIRDLTSYEHHVNYYGPDAIDNVAHVLTNQHRMPESLKPLPESKQFEEIEMTENKVYFCEYDMVQSELMLLHRGGTFNEALLPEVRVFNQYFGSGLSSIVFQEIRESKALAYSAYASYTTPDKADRHHYVQAYIGSQVDKLEDATAAMLELMNTIPRAEKQFEQAKISALKKIETNRTTGRNILWSYENALDLGLNYDMNEKIYPKIKEIDFAAVETFFNSNVKGKPFTHLVIGKKAEVDMDALKKLGPVQELTLEELFGY